VVVGAGPGSPDLLTLRAVERIRAAEVIVHDALVPRRILDEINPSAERIPVARDAAPRPNPGVATGHLLARLALEGRSVVRLKGGDPGVFARLTEELEPLRHAGIPVEIVPGVTAALAAAAAAGVSLTNREAASSCTIVTGREADDKADTLDYTSLASLPGTLAVYMGIEQVARWSRAVIDAGRPGDTPVTIVSRCSWPDQQVGLTTLEECAADIARHGWRSPAVVLVGASAEPVAGPLQGRRVLVTRPSGQEGELIAAIRAAGGACVHVPLIEIVEPRSWDGVDAAIARIDTYDWIVFASSNGVRAFFRRLAALGRDGRDLGTVRLAAIGQGTRRQVETCGYRCDLTADVARSEGLLEALGTSPRGGRFLLLRADKGRDVLRRGLESFGHHVDEVAVYESRAVEAPPESALGTLPIDWLVLTSSFTAETALHHWGDRLRSWKIATISPVTSSVLLRAGIHPSAEATEASAIGIVAAMVRREEESAEVDRPAGSPGDVNLPPIGRD